MRTDRLIILVAILGLMLCLVLSSVLVPRINAQRVELQFTANEDLTKNLPPEYAIPYIALGAFRGPVLNFLWIRLEDMKQEGKFWECKQLSEVITRLQPRFPHVWANRAWNLAYNISVATHTARERWFWVRSGIDLLRDEGIPQNPNSILLYKELSWIFLHKIGMFSDDLHRYYKAKLAEEWHFLLGEPPYGKTDLLDESGKPVLCPGGEVTGYEDGEETLCPGGEPLTEWAAIAAFRPIAHVYDRYINTLNISLAARPQIKKLLADEGLREEVEKFAELPALRMLTKARKLHDKLSRKEPEQAKRLEPLIATLSELESRQQGDPLARFLEGEPECRKLVDQLASMGLKPDPTLMEKIGRMRAAVAINAKQAQEGDPRLREMFGDPALMDLENRDRPAAKLITFMRALTFDRKYHMDPLWMLELMEGRWFVHPDRMAEIEKDRRIPAMPVDWRHPGAHGMYWASMGVRKSQGLVKPASFDLLNTDRQILHGLQALMHGGKLLYDPFAGPDGGYLTLLPDTRFIDAYHYAVESSTWRNPAERLKGAAVVDSFQAGHENFLTWAVQELYFAGEEFQAQRYYKLLRDTFSTREGERTAARFRKPLPQFVMDEFNNAEEIEDDDRVRGVVNSFLRRSIEEGLAANRPDTTKRMLDTARVVYDNYQRSQDFRTTRGPDEINRMSLRPFPDLFAEALQVYLTQVTGPAGIRFKARAWENVSVYYRQRLYDLVKPQLARECEMTGADMALAFPEPPGMEEYRQAKGLAKPDAGDQPYVSEKRSGMR